MAENAPQPFSTSQASTKSKRHSLNIISTGPRPLQLASGSVLSSPSRSPSRSPALHNSSADSPPGPLSPFGPSSVKVKNGRRQSSISYLPSSKDRRMSLVSPLSPTGFFRGMALRNGSSAAAAGSAGVEREIEQNPRSTMDALNQSKGRPITLAEKHAELLHFIAQKESKCLELRSQLASHEAELLQLKRKWERIVNRGFEKTSSSTLPSPTTPYTPSSLATNAASSSSGIVLEGIKEGVQGMGRFITAGLGSIAHVGVADGHTPVSSFTSTISPTPRGNRRLSSKSPVPLRLGSGNNYEHESQSSSSTSASFTTHASSSTSATSLMLEPGTTQDLSPPFTSTSDEAPNNFDEFGDFEEAPTQSIDELVEQEENPEQILMVHDTGATPTMSPNPHFRRRDRMEVEQQKDPASDMSGLDSGWDDECTTSGTSTIAVDRINDFMNSGFQKDTSSSSSSSVTHTVQPFPTKPPKIKTPSLPGVSSIPGLALSSMPTNGTTPQSMSTWVESVGKKWGEIRESPTFTKSQKRASILLSDVSQSIVSALISPSPLSASSRPGTSSKSALETPFTMNVSHTPSHAEPTITTNKNEIPMSTSFLDDLDIGEVDESLKLKFGSPILVPDQTTKNNLNPRTKLKSDLGMNDVPGVSSSNFIDDEDWNW